MRRSLKKVITMLMTIVMIVLPVTQVKAELHIVSDGKGGYYVKNETLQDQYIQGLIDQINTNKAKQQAYLSSIGAIDTASYNGFNMILYGTSSAFPVSCVKNADGSKELTVAFTLINHTGTTIGISSCISATDASGNFLINCNIPNGLYCPLSDGQGTTFYNTYDVPAGSDLSTVYFDYSYMDYSQPYWNEYNDWMNGGSTTLVKLISDYPVKSVMEMSMITTF